MDENNLCSLEEAALKRKERLKNLQNKRTGEQEENATSLENCEKPKFRSYRPLDKTLDQDEADKTKIDSGIDEQIQDQLELLKTPIEIDEIDITTLAPRKQDWDLKRDISKKLEKLEWLTQKAIAELIRERLKENQENIFEAVNVGTAQIQSEQTTE